MSREIYMCEAHGEVDPAEVIIEAPAHEGRVTMDPTEEVLDAFTPKKIFHKGCGLPLETEYQRV